MSKKVLLCESRDFLQIGIPNSSNIVSAYAKLPLFSTSLLSVTKFKQFSVSSQGGGYSAKIWTGMLI